AGVVQVTLENAHRVAIDNVVSYRLARDVAVNVAGVGAVPGGVAWGGDWFFLVKGPAEGLRLAKGGRPTPLAWGIRCAGRGQGHPGAGGGKIDHIELFGPPSTPAADSKNFVLCPGKAYDRSPCGTGTSAKLACLAADGKLREGDVWRQESIIGSI